MLAAKGRERIAMMTAYDAPAAALLDAAGLDVLLVGDSLGMVVLGYPTTVPVTMDDMLHHTKAVVRGTQQALVVADMPFMSYQTGPTDALRNAARFLKEAGAQRVLDGLPPGPRLDRRLASAFSGVSLTMTIGSVARSSLARKRFQVWKSARVYSSLPNNSSRGTSSGSPRVTRRSAG